MAIAPSYLINLITDIIDKKLAEGINIAIGTITAYDPDTYTAKVFLQYEQVETDFIRIGGGAAGNGYGDKVPVAINDEVIVAFYSGTAETGLLISRIYSDPTDPPPTTADPADRVIQHSTGSKVTFSANGDVSLAASAKTTAKLGQDGSFAVSNGNGAVKINTDNSIEISNDQTKILLSHDGKISLSNSTVELLDLIDQLLTQLTTASNILVAYPSGIGSFSPAVLPLITQIKTQLATLKA